MQPGEMGWQRIGGNFAVLENNVGKENAKKASSTYKLIKRELE